MRSCLPACLPRLPWLKSYSLRIVHLTDYLPQNMRQHLPPPGPVVIDVGSPQIEGVRNSFGDENLRELLAAFRIFIGALPRKNVNGIGLAQNRQVMLVV